MAINTAPKRMAAMLAGAVIFPDGLIDLDEKQWMLGQYRLFQPESAVSLHVRINRADSTNRFIERGLTGRRYVERSKSFNVER